MFNVYFMFVCVLGFTQSLSLREDDLSMDSEEDNVEPPDLLEHNNKSPRLFKCHICDDKTECHHPRICENALVVNVSSIFLKFFDEIKFFAKKIP